MLVYGDPPIDRPVIGHACNRPDCCNPTHLSAVTQSENIQYMYDCNRHPVHYSKTRPELLSRGDKHYSRTNPGRLARGERNGFAKMSETTVREIRALHAAGVKQAEIARRLSLNFSTVSVIVRRKTWRHVE